tara:strand:- start:4511 stop:5059 length:549 start_codon:yes stop_codon:yes gene_type:complete
MHCLEEHINIVTHLKDSITQIKDIAQIIIDALIKQRSIYWYGNGGSAADSQHLAAELMGRFKRDRKALRSVALTTDTSVLTAIGNDFEYKNIFERQVEGLVQKGDVVVGISTSGNSQNVIQAHKKALDLGAQTVSLLGCQGGHLVKYSNRMIIVPSEDTARIQESHILIGHIICDLVEEVFA